MLGRPGGVRWPPGLAGLPPRARGPGLGPAAARGSARAAPCPVAPTAHKRSARLVGGRSSLAPPCGGPPPFLPAPRGRLRRGPCPCAAVLRGGAPAPRFAAPVRRMAPSLRLRSGRRGRAPAAAPPALPLGPCAPLRGSAGARCPRCAWARLPRRGGLPPPCSGRPSLCSASPLRFAWARRVPPPPSASRLRARGAPAPGACAALAGRLFRLRPPGLWRAAGALLACACARCAARCLRRRWWSVGSPLPPPPPLPPPLGARGVRVASGPGGSPPPLRGSPGWGPPGPRGCGPSPLFSGGGSAARSRLVRRASRLPFGSLRSA